MEASAAFHRCVRQAFIKPTRCRNIGSSTSFSRPAQQSITRTSQRSFLSTSRTSQNSPAQPRVASNERSSLNAAPPQAEKVRIDLSTLTNPQTDAANTNTPKPQSASAKLDALFSRPQRPNQSSAENPFARTLRQTNARNPPAQFDSSPISFANLFADFETSAPAPPNADTKLPLRLKPTLGRTQTVDNGRGLDLTRAFRMLESKCSFNQVRRDLIKQKNHVRRGQRRKIERSLRWRRAFRDGFLAECARVRRMKNQGW